MSTLPQTYSTLRTIEATAARRMRNRIMLIAVVALAIVVIRSL